MRNVSLNELGTLGRRSRCQGNQQDTIRIYIRTDQSEVPIDGLAGESRYEKCFSMLLVFYGHSQNGGQRISFLSAAVQCGENLY